MGLDVFDIVAVILGVIFTIRKLDAQRREPEEFAHVDREAFIAWRSRETFVYTVGMMACFAKVLAKTVVALFIAERMAFSDLRLLGAAIDIPWFVLVIYVLVAAYRLALRRAQLRIVLGGFVVDSGSGLSAELKDAVTELKAGRFETADYRLKQITLDSDESLRGIALYYLGESYRLQGRIEEASDALLESLEVDPTLQEPKVSLEKIRRRSTDEEPS